jgi:hypothetical protein
MLVAYACHPVTLGADNLSWTADYPHFVRRDIEAAHPGAVALFLTAATGDVNTGHSAYDSMKLGAAPARTFAEAERLGAIIARNALAAPLAPLESSRVSAARSPVSLDLLDRDAPMRCCRVIQTISGHSSRMTACRLPSSPTGIICPPTLCAP